VKPSAWMTGRILDLLDSLKARLGLTLVLVSHDLAVVGRLCDRVMVLRDGRVVESGPTKAMFERPRSAYTQRLLDAVPVLPVP
jgi:ABC-type dipeptide/oligopeptide/nickel transport system ATPase component